MSTIWTQKTQKSEAYFYMEAELFLGKINIKKRNNNFDAEISYIFNENIAQTSELSVTD